MRSGVGAVCILTRAVRDVAGFFFVLPDVLDFTGATDLFVCKAMGDLACAADFAVEFLELDFVVVDCAATYNGADKIHKPPASNRPPAARRIIAFALLNAPR